MSSTPSSYAVILDDHPLVARGVAEFLRALHPDMEVRLATDAADCLRLVKEHGAPALALVDFWLIDGAALGLIAQLRADCPGTAIAVMSGDDDPLLGEQARAAGAHGFVHKQESPDTFAQAVHALLGGLTWFSQAARVQPGGLRSRELPVTPLELGLSVRQGEILALVLLGQPNKRIALDLALSESTVKEHVTAILQRLGARNRIEAITQLRGRRLVLAAGPAG
jgi:DNA-binding NarL/FixJ family response regulator